MKKVVFLLVDSFMPVTLEDALNHRTVPALQFLMDRGQYRRECTTVFPTMTATVDSSLLTGVYPDVHKVPGLIWFDPAAKQVINYGNGWRCVWKLGISKCLRHALFDLNERHLSKQVTTLYEELADLGITSASINTIIHRGRRTYQVRLPFPLNLMKRVQIREEITGPDVMTLGSFLKTDSDEKIPRRLKGIGKRLGINDDYAVEVAKDLIRKGQPDFMLVYLPDNDHQVHKKNPAHAETALIQVDHQIQDLLNMYDSWEDALNKCVFIVTGDHGQTRVGGEKQEFIINLDQLLSPFKVLELGENLGEHDLAVANNERSAFLYPLKPDLQQEIVQHLLSDSRIDLIAYKQEKGVAVKEGGSGREIFYEPGGPYQDPYGSTWNITGEWRVLDLHQAHESVEYGDYPDALARLYGALYSQDFPMIVINARPRYEFQSRYYPKHLKGGCHGSLHKFDSLVPLIVSGSSQEIPEKPRLVDLKRYIVSHFLSDQDSLRGIAEKNNSL